MKKILVLTAVLAFVASSCFATDITSGATGTMSLSASTGLELHADPTTAAKGTALIGKSSTGVSVAWNTSVGGYALMTQHKSGTKAYGSSYDSTALFQTTSTSVVPGTAAYNAGVMSKTDTTDFVTGWKAM